MEKATREDVRAKFREWRTAGRPMRKYIYGEGDAYIQWLLNLKDVSHRYFDHDFEQEYPYFIPSIMGPHGWVYLQALIIKAEERTRKKRSKRREADEKAKANT